MERPYRPVESFRVRRSCLAVPASSERFISKARTLPADEVFLDLEDAVAPAAKAQARARSTRPTRCSRRPRTISRARRGLSRRTRTPRASGLGRDAGIGSENT
jgi:citrate lyase beta subunit